MTTGLLILLLLSFYNVGNSQLKLWMRERNESIYCETPDCLPFPIRVFLNGEWSNGREILVSPEDCDTDDDIASIICPNADYNFPCVLFTPWGTRVSSCVDISVDDSVFIVPDDRLYMIPSKGVGYRTKLRHIAQHPIVLESLSVSPKIFRAKGFLTPHEADEFISIGQNLFSSQEYKRPNLFPATEAPFTGDIDEIPAGYELTAHLKQRIFDFLGIFPFDDSMIEPIQIIRLQTGEAAAAHHDWISPDNDESDLSGMGAGGPGGDQRGGGDRPHDFNSAYQGGSNRYATFFIALDQSPNLVGDHLVFPLTESTDAATCGNSRDDRDNNDQLHRNDNNNDDGQDETCQAQTPGIYSPSLPSSSGWERELLQQCETRFRVHVDPLDAIVFYSQKANGVPDYLSFYGLCPLLSSMAGSGGEKWYLLVQVWNGPRPGLTAAASMNAVSASFESKDVVTAKLFWEDQVWEELVPNRPIKVNTFAGHKWHVKMDGNELVKTWIIQPGKRIQRFILRSEDLPTFFY